MSPRVKYHVFVDRRQIMSLLAGVFSGWMTVMLVQENDSLWWLFFGILTLIMTAVASGLPCLYIMTPKGLHLIHTFGLIRRFIPWDSVVGLEVNYDTGYKRLPYLFDTFRIYGDVKGPTFFFTEDEMVRTLRARILLERYTGLKVEGFMLDDLRAWRKKRKEKQERMRRHKERMARVERNRRVKQTTQKRGKTTAKKSRKQAKRT